MLQPPEPAPLPAPADSNWLDFLPDFLTDGRIDWGNAPSWVALSAAITAAIYAVRTFKQQASQIRALEDEKRSEHAQQIAAWIEEDQSRDKLLIHVVNNSNVPAHAGLAWIIHPGIDSLEKVGGLNKTIVIRPGEMEIEISKDISYPAFAGIAFMDSGGRIWVRWGAYPLIELKDGESFGFLEKNIPTGSERNDFDLPDFLSKHAVHVFTSGPLR